VHAGWRASAFPGDPVPHSPALTQLSVAIKRDAAVRVTIDRMPAQPE
jgi:hypothetical protein